MCGSVVYCVYCVCIIVYYSVGFTETALEFCLRIGRGFTNLAQNFDAWFCKTITA